MRAVVRQDAIAVFWLPPDRSSVAASASALSLRANSECAWSWPQMLVRPRQVPSPSVRCVYPNLPTADYAPLEATATDFAGKGRILWLTAGIQRIVSAQPVDHLLENGLILSSLELKTLPDI
jgi:hypothetical protein